MTEREQAPRSFVVPAALVFAAGLLSFAISSARAPVAFSFELTLLLLAALLSENYAVALRGFTVSLAFPLVIASVPLYGPGAAGLVAAMTFTNLAEIRSRRPISVLAFNLGQVLLWGTSAGWAYRILGGPLLGEAATLVPIIPSAGVALLAAAAVGTVVNFVLAGLGVSILKSMPYSRVLSGVIEYVPTHLALAFVGLLIALVLYMNPIAFPLFLFPLFLARQVFHRYSELKDAYLDTVTSFIGALEAKDPYTRGHSERVAAYALEIALHMGMGATAAENLHRAALLHDIGKLSLPASLLTKPGSLDDREFEQMREHPGRGSEMVARIPALRHLADIVRVHHERIDGTGYPTGRSQSAIPIEGRVLAVADAYDAMTSERSYRSAMSHAQAISELLAGAGKQFDVDVVRAFIEAGIGLGGYKAPEDQTQAGVLAAEPVQ